MIIPGKDSGPEERLTWKQEGDLLDFLSSIQAEVDRFNQSFDFDIRYHSSQSLTIDGNEALARKVGFVLTRSNSLMPGTTHCLYSLLDGTLLQGFIGIYKNGRIRTLKELKPIRDFKKGQEIFYVWLRQLMRASMEKMNL